MGNDQRTELGIHLAIVEMEIVGSNSGKVVNVIPTGTSKFKVSRWNLPKERERENCFNSLLTALNRCSNGQAKEVS